MVFSKELFSLSWQKALGTKKRKQNRIEKGLILQVLNSVRDDDIKHFYFYSKIKYYTFAA